MAELPREIWALILGNLSRSDLLNLCLTNRQWLALAQPHFYLKILYDWSHNKPPLVLASLARTLVRRPDLAATVRSITLLSTWTGADIKSKIKITTPDDDFADLVQAARELELPFALDVAEAVARGDLDGFVTLLLALTPNICHLKLTAHFAENTPELSRLALHAAAAAQQDNTITNDCSPLRSLRQVEYLPSMHLFRPSNTNNASEVLPLFYLPSLQRLSANMETSEVPFQWLASTPPPQLTSLTHLALENTRELPLQGILQQATAVQHLSWTWVYDTERTAPLNSPAVQLDALREALRPLRSTLKALTLRGSAEGIMGDADIAVRGDLGWLREMTNLEMLETTPRFFMSDDGHHPAATLQLMQNPKLHECLPPSIRKVCFTDDLCWRNDEPAPTSQDQLAAIDKWWRVKYQFTPRLERFQLHLMETDDQWLLAERNMLAEMGKKCNVNVHVHKELADLD